jgi:hypothetical protein
MSLNKITTVVILMVSLLLAFASANTCGAYCNNDSDCYQGGYVECGKCNLYQGTLGYKTCYNEQPESEPPTPAPTTHNFFPEGGSCRQECTTNADCQNGGFNPCGECGQMEGTEMFHLCYQPQEADDEGSRRLDSCGASCDSDSDCYQGGVITCGTCNLWQGTLGYKTCYNDEPEPPTPAPTSHDFFPIGGSCRNTCESNADCQNGGFNPCGKCGQEQGTEMYHVCYQPNNEGRRRLRGSM